jgi:FecR protein
MFKAKLTLAAIGLFMASAASAAPPDGWKISEKSGTVTVLHSGVSKIALQGNAITMGDVVNTGANGRAVLVRGQEYLVIAPNSRLRIADPAPSGGMIQILQDVGNVIFKIKRKSTPHFAVQTPYLAAVVKGTTFSVTVNEAGASVQVIEGAVEVNTNDGGARDLVRPGMIAAVNARNLFQLKIDGDTSHVTVSPNAPADGGNQAPAPQSDESLTETSETSVDASAQQIGSPIVETVQSASLLTGGLIEGNTSFASPVRALEVKQETAAVIPPVVSETVAPVATAAPTPAAVAVVEAPAAPVAAPLAAAETPVAASPVAVAVAPAPVELPPVSVVDAVVVAAPVVAEVAAPAPPPAAVVAPVVPAPVEVAVAVAPVVPAPVAAVVAPIAQASPAAVAVVTPVVPVVVEPVVVVAVSPAPAAVILPVSNGNNGNAFGNGNGNAFGNSNGNNGNASGNGNGNNGSNSRGGFRNGNGRSGD